MLNALPISIPKDVINVLDNLDLLKENQFLIDTDIFYHNVPVRGAFIEDDLNNRIDLSVGDILNIQTLVREKTLDRQVPNDLFFYQLQYSGINHIGILFAVDRNLKIYGIPVDSISFKFSDLYKQLGFKNLCNGNDAFFGDYMTPSFANVLQLVSSLNKNILFSEYVFKRLGRRPLFPYTEQPFLFPTDTEGKYIISTIRNKMRKL
ncbi:MAG: hypothetical protein J6Y03_03550 [Alphaproteobacteria bacterium]|nr:hypothetical protein [Alphaproteobacteria bacterium]